MSAAGLRVLRGKKPLPVSSGLALTRTPPAPSWLSESARETWREVAPGLVKLGLLTPLDLSGLAVYCTCVGHWRDAQAVLAREGVTVVNKRGELAPHSLAVMARGFAREARSWGLLYGLSPLGRKRLGL